MNEDINATVDTVGEDVEGGELEGVRGVGGSEGGGLPNRTAAGVEGGGEGREGGEGGEGEGAMSTSPMGGGGLMEVEVDGGSLVEGGAAGP